MDALSQAMQGFLNAGPRLMNWAGSFGDNPGASVGGNMVTGVREVAGPGGPYYVADMKDPVNGKTWTDNNPSQAVIGRAKGPNVTQATPGAIRREGKAEQNDADTKELLRQRYENQRQDALRQLEESNRLLGRGQDLTYGLGVDSNNVTRTNNDQAYDTNTTNAHTNRADMLMRHQMAQKAFEENQLNSRRDLLLRGGSAALEARHQGLTGLGDGIARAGELLARAF